MGKQGRTHATKPKALSLIAKIRHTDDELFSDLHRHRVAPVYAHIHRPICTDTRRNIYILKPSENKVFASFTGMVLNINI